MYTIKQAAARSGVPVQLLRAWERRYGVVEPVRTSSGYRLYDEPAIRRLRAMRQLIAEGWAASTAAARVIELDDAEIGEVLRPTTSESPTGDAGIAVQSDSTQLREAFVTASARLDEAGMERVLDQMFARGSFEHVAGNLLMPTLADIGEGWQSGRLDVAAEHAAAGAIARRLGGSFMAAGTPRDDSRPVLVGLPPGSRHELGALAFATAARRAGISVRYLGADLPVDDWLEAAARTAARAVVIGVVIRADVEPAGRVAQALKDAQPGLLICFGGRHAADVAAADGERVIVLAGELDSAVTQLEEALAAG